MNSVSPSIHQLSRDFCQVWLLTQGVKPQKRERAHGYWSKPLFVPSYPWIQVYLPIMSRITIRTDGEHRAGRGELEKPNLRRGAREDVGNVAEPRLYTNLVA